MATIAITGSSGFVGGRFAQRLARRPGIEARALVRRGKPPQLPDDGRLAIVRGDITDAPVLAQLLNPGCAVVNFAFDAAAPAQANLAAADALAEACLKHGVRRLVHCSTAVVAGRTRASRIDEATACHPSTEYERTKLAIENLLRDRARGRFELAILRPTAVFGPGGRNLLKMARDLTQSSRLANYVRSSAHCRHRLHLVHVDNVVAAAEFLVATAGPVDQEIFIVSDDDAPENNFRDVERYLMRAFGIAEYTVPRVALPSAALALLLRLRGRSLINPDAVFAGDKLRSRDCARPVDFASGIAAFAEWYKNTVAAKAGAN